MNIKKMIYIIFGSICVGFGFLGVFIPLLPTTPFLLLAAWFYIRSSEKAYYWLLNNKILGKYITNYVKKKGMTHRNKISTLITLWASISISFVLINNFHLRIFLSIVVIAVTTHILMLNTIYED